MQPNNPIKVHVMHADHVVSAGLSALLSVHPDLLVTNQFSDSQDGERAEVLISDYHGGMLAARALPTVRQGNAARVLIVTQFDKEWEVRSAMDGGVHGYLLQGCTPEELLRAVHFLSKGLRYLSDAVTRCVADSLSRETLTGRETDVLQLLAKGCCNKLIARELGIGVGTVKTHVKGLMSKLDATARTHAVVVATQRGLIGAGQRAHAHIITRTPASGFVSAALQ